MAENEKLKTHYRERLCLERIMFAHCKKKLKKSVVSQFKTRNSAPSAVVLLHENLAKLPQRSIAMYNPRF